MTVALLIDGAAAAVVVSDVPMGPLQLSRIAHTDWPVERPTCDRAAIAVTYRCDQSEGPTFGSEAINLLEFLARVQAHIPDRRQAPRSCAPRATAQCGSWRTSCRCR